VRWSRALPGSGRGSFAAGSAGAGRHRGSGEAPCALPAFCSAGRPGASEPGAVVRGGRRASGRQRAWAGRSVGSRDRGVGSVYRGEVEWVSFAFAIDRCDEPRRNKRNGIWRQPSEASTLRAGARCEGDGFARVAAVLVGRREPLGSGW